MIQLSELNKEKTYATKKKKKRKQEPKLERSPFNTPAHYLNYGRGAYIVLCYAGMRSRMKLQKKEWFTPADFVRFQEDRVNLKAASGFCARLASIGYLERRRIDRSNNHWDRTRGILRYEYHYTDLGDHALRQLARIHKRKIADQIAREKDDDL